jgi:Fe-S-cluster containining protein
LGNPRLDELYDKLDAFFTKGLADHRDEMECRAGCSDCCKRFSVTGVEAERIEEVARALEPSLRTTIAERAQVDEQACPALVDGLCAIYEARPAICRTHGLPIRFVDPDPERRSLPMISACEKNFRGRDLEAIAKASVLDQTTVSTILGALEAAHAAARGESPSRIAIAELLSALA